jgi:hypothetical protein
MTARPGSEARRRLTRYWWVGVLAIVAGVGIALGWRIEAPSPGGTATLSAGTPVASAARRETRPTLDPARFVGKAADAHRVARDIPEVLDQLYCYCECDKHLGHKSLLSCYTDGHAAT